jgi:23S rRNA (uracil1939-C5)-methyltransferase
MELAKEKDRTFEVEIERLLPGGVGLAHAEGLTLFVSLAAPGEVVRISVDRVQGKIGFASIVEIVKPSPVRIDPPCPYFGLCGGCDFQQLTYEAQLNAKVEIIRDCLHRIAKIDSPSDIQIHPSPSAWHYRARAMWQLDGLRGRLGYFVRGSNEVCDVEYCAVLVPELQDALQQARIQVLAEDGPVLKDIEAVAGDEGVSTVSHPPDIVRFPGRDVSRVIGGETYFFSAEAFFQINHLLLEPLIAEALRDIPLAVQEEGRGGTAVDLYCGVGLFTLPLARRFARVVGVEANGRSTKFARRNLEGISPTMKEGSSQSSVDSVQSTVRGSSPTSVSPAGQPGWGGTVREGAECKFGSVEIVTARVGDWLNHHSRSFGPVDFLLLDPPRTGAENKDIAGILALRPAQISYVSCDPATLARDLKKLINAGYSLDSLVAFDMFPQTHHVETVVRLSAKGI